MKNLKKFEKIALSKFQLNQVNGGLGRVFSSKGQRDTTSTASDDYVYFDSSSPEFGVGVDIEANC